jgi:hypothetical protein
MTRDDIIRMALEALWPRQQILNDLPEISRFANLIAAAERERIEAAGRSLYEITGDIKDANSVVIQRNDLRARIN